MSVVPMRDRRAERNAATRAEILEAAWALVREEGLAGLSLRDLGRRVGMRAQSLYSYFDSKHAIYDAMFAEGWRELLDRIDATRFSDDPLVAFRQRVHLVVDFATEDLARYQLLFQRTIPGFEPSPESYALAVEALELTKAQLAALGLTEPRHLDLTTAVIAGLVAQQHANDPAGDRWIRLVDEAVDMLMSHLKPRSRRR
jgi:AcrR family transcriptional regulator